MLRVLVIGSGRRTDDSAETTTIPAKLSKLDVLLASTRESPGRLRETISILSGIRAPWRVEVRKIPPADLPRHFLGLDAADLVILEASAVPEMDAERLEPLLEWTRRGGTLAAIAGPAWSGRSVPRELLDALGLRGSPRASEPSQARQLIEAARRPSPGAVKPEQEEGDGASLAVFSLEPADGARLAEDGLLAEARSGAGSVFVHAIAQPVLFPRGREQAPGLGRCWKRTLAAARLSRSDRESLEGLERDAYRAIADFSGFRFPSRDKVAIFVLAYAGIGIVLGGIVFRRLRRLEGMYIVAAFLAAGASVWIWRFGLLAGFQELAIDAYTVARLRPGSSIADSITWVGISSPVRRSLPVNASPDGPGILVPYVAGRAIGEKGAGDFQTLAIRIEGGRIAIPEVEVLPNATRILRFDGPIDVGAELAAAVREERAGWLLRPVDVPLFPSSVLGPIRRSMGRIIAHVEGPAEEGR